MSDSVIPHPEPRPEHPGSDPDADRVSDEIAALAELAATGIEVDGQAEVAERLWAIYGHSTYDGELILGEYDDAAEATEVLRSTPGATPAPDDPVQ
jgi:hypothetical protein